MKKVGYLFIPLLIGLLIVFGYFIINKKTKIEKFYLDDKYYNSNEFIELNSTELDNLTGNYVVFTYNYYCQFSIPCEDIFKEYMKENNISFISIPFEQFKNAKMHKIVTYAPSIILVKDGDVVSFLSTDRDEDVDRYQDVNKFTDWINEYIYTKSK